MPERQFRPGRRNAPPKPKGKITHARLAWANTDQGEFVILQHEEDETPEYGQDIQLYMVKPGRPPLAMILTRLTGPELDAVEKILQLVVEYARPIVKRRDKEAQDAWANGDDTFRRIYRRAPELVDRKRPVGEHSEGVQQRPEGVSEGDRRDVDPDGRVRGAGNELAESDSDNSGAEDDWT